MILTKIILHRAIAFIYLIAFLVSWNQFKALCGVHGLLPIKRITDKQSFKKFPSLFWINHSDFFTQSISGLGILLSCFALFGFADNLGWTSSFVTWFLLWVFYLSFVNMGQTFYAFGWESMLLETGFLAIFLGPDHVQTPYTTFILFQWLLFRNMFGAGMIKIRGSRCWKKLTCLDDHFETQPIPNPFSRFFHRLPKIILKSGVLFNHFVELIVPFFLFIPGPIGAYAALITILFQGFLIISGNFSWLNYLTCVLCIACFDDSFWTYFELTPPQGMIQAPLWFWAVSVILFVLIIFFSKKPLMNLFAKRQIMNTSFDAYHIINTYGAFGSITKPRYELIIEGTLDERLDEETEWQEYIFKAKPCSIYRSSPFVAPYHLRLDWLMWFAAMSSYLHHPWIVSLVHKLLHNEKNILKLIKENPFESEPPKYIRIRRYVYSYAKRSDKYDYWQKKFLDDYLLPVSAENKSIRQFLISNKLI